MLRIAAAQFAPHLKIGLLPKAGKVLGELYGLETRREQFHEHRHTTVIHAWCLPHTKTFLQAHTQHGCYGSETIIQTDAAACRYRDM